MPPATILLRVFLFFAILIAIIYALVWLIGFVLSGKAKLLLWGAKAFTTKEEGIADVKGDKMMKKAEDEIRKEKRKK